MEKKVMLSRMRSSSSSSVNVFVIIMLLSLSADAYKNYTVGGSTGWFSIQEKPSLNYQKWADYKTFSLGDFLIFNTDSNHSVVRTYDSKTYEECDYNGSEDNSTKEWSAANPSSKSHVPVSISVPLVKEGSNYFFSGSYDGEQCKFGQHFMINVTHGQGLPDKDEKPTSGPAEPPQTAEDEVAPDTIVPANFDHPKDMENDHNDDDDDDDDDKPVHGNTSSSSITKSNFFGLVLLWFIAASVFH